MRVVFSQFFNEAYLLPWWLDHHRRIFDHGVLIDSNSSDESADICRRMVPTWEIVRPEYMPFEALLRDFEIMKHEARFPTAWKIVLNTTEFLVAPDLAALEQYLESTGGTSARLPSAVMVDVVPRRVPSPKRPLTEQKDAGFWETDVTSEEASALLRRFGSHRRVYHRYPIGAYGPGRHISHLPNQHDAPREQAAIWWYGFSPWTKAFVDRKRQIGPSIAEHDRKAGFGFQHQMSNDAMEEARSKLIALAGPLMPRRRTSARPLSRLFSRIR